MDGQCGLDAERFKAPFQLHLQVIATDAAHGCFRLVKQFPLLQWPVDCGAFVQQMGREVPAKNWSEDRFEALRTDDENCNVLSMMYDRACEFFGVKALTVGQLPALKYAAALGLVP